MEYNGRSGVSRVPALSISAISEAERRGKMAIGGKTRERRRGEGNGGETKAVPMEHVLPFAIGCQRVLNSSRVDRRQNPEQVSARIYKQQYIHRGTVSLGSNCFRDSATWETSVALVLLGL